LSLLGNGKLLTPGKRSGRPSCISDSDTSTPLPININESEFHKRQSLYAERHSSSTASNTTATSSHSKGQVKGKASSHQSSITNVSTSRKPSTSFSPIDPSLATYDTLPIPLTRLPMTTSTYFIYCTSLSVISHEILTQLYCAALVKSKWSSVQKTISRMQNLFLSCHI
jgi:hypothetical protein